MAIPTIIDAQGKPTAKNDFIEKQVIVPYLGMLSAKEKDIRKYNELLAEIEEGISQITDAQSANYFAEHINDYKHIGSSLMKARSLFSAKVNELGLLYNKETKSYEDKAA